MASASKTVINTYEYMDETNIDDELKCTVCTQPFQIPVSLSCQHTFCRECITLWLNENHSCPTCRRSLIMNQDEQLSPINTYIVNNQLDRLLVRCDQCHEENIQRGNFQDHESKCSKRLVPCPAVDIECSWKGPRDEQDTHVTQCSFQQIRPIIDRLQTQLYASLQIQNELNEKLENQSEQINFLLAFINHGNTMNKECVKLYNRCYYSMCNQNKSQITFQCTICEDIIKRRRVALHTCSLNDRIDCICKICYEKQYPIPDDTDEEN